MTDQEARDNEEIMHNVILPSLKDKDDPTLFNKVSIILYDTYGKPMGAPLCAVITYVIKELKRREADNENKLDV